LKARIHQSDPAGNEAADYALSWLETDSQPRAIVNGQHAILWSNIAAGRLFADRQGMEIRGGFLHPTDAMNQAALRNFLGRAASGLATWCIERPKRDGWVLMRARPLDWPSSATFGICFTEATERNRARYDHLDTAFGLTRAEHRVLLDLLDGNDADTLAARHGVTVDTTRTHIRSIYLKVGVSSRERLFARLQAFRA
jgi:DNA-binding CsgD family transcriptional regulator